LLSGRRVLSRQITRLSRRSVLVDDIDGFPPAATLSDRSAHPRAAKSTTTARPALASLPSVGRPRVSWRAGSVVAIGRRWPGAVELDVDLAGAAAVRALAYPAVVGEPVVGDRVLLNVTALDRGLGTGGFALVVAIPDR